ncbi:unnamed protein product, partial [Trichogramma brassicae]
AEIRTTISETSAKRQQECLEAPAKIMPNTAWARSRPTRALMLTRHMRRHRFRSSVWSAYPGRCADRRRRLHPSSMIVYIDENACGVNSAVDHNHFIRRYVRD